MSIATRSVGLQETQCGQFLGQHIWLGLRVRRKKNSGVYVFSTIGLTENEQIVSVCFDIYNKSPTAYLKNIQSGLLFCGCLCRTVTAADKPPSEKLYIFYCPERAITGNVTEIDIFRDIETGEVQFRAKTATCLVGFFAPDEIKLILSKIPKTKASHLKLFKDRL